MNKNRTKDENTLLTYNPNPSLPLLLPPSWPFPLHPPPPRAQLQPPSSDPTQTCHDWTLLLTFKFLYLIFLFAFSLLSIAAASPSLSPAQISTFLLRQWFSSLSLELQIAPSLSTLASFSSSLGLRDLGSLRTIPPILFS
ncbi:hypothetical protein CRG98_044760 [Punica granatum]|uniref:Uncharacterized protein n=1 Tax=Punica granatum TaxID=22663 RepID=A0A2I0HUC4_PUNGR|nr:hypothetical protein CRG98_044760 [Punica granatum]